MRLGARPVKLDLSIVLGIWPPRTCSIGIGATYSTTYYTPFHVARTFATLDHLSARAGGWNVVTSVNDSEAQNYGLTEHIPHDARGTTGPTSSSRRPPGCGTPGTTMPSSSTVQADRSPTPTRCTSSDTTASGSTSVGRSPCPAARKVDPSCSRPGSSGRGRHSRPWAELIFTGDPDIDIARAHYKDQKGHRRARPGPRSVKMLPMAYTVVGESTAHAEEREQLFLHDLVDPMASLTLLSELMNYDFSGLGARRTHHRRTHRVRVGHPWAGAEHPRRTSAARP